MTSEPLFSRPLFLYIPQQPRTVDDRGDLNDIGLDSVNDAVILEHEFPEIKSAILRNDPSGIRELSDGLDPNDDPLGEGARKDRNLR
jgi:hypothetical protein